MPWPLFNRPSIQLGTLKAYLEANADWIKVDTAHPYLETATILGTELYHRICQNSWISEALYAPLVFPEMKNASEALALKLAAKEKINITEEFIYEDFHKKLAAQLAEWVNGYDWKNYAIVGFTVCFNQLFASLAAASSIKEKHPHITIVFGGSACAANAGKSLPDVFEYVDYVIQGEGEQSLLKLCEYLSDRSTTLTANTFSKTSENRKNPDKNSQISSLEKLPVPDYDDYFTEQKKWFQDNPFIPVLPVEFSRGCWWNRCAFCNLNLQWYGYRFKKAQQMLDEVLKLSTKFDCLDFTFTDNMIPPKESSEFFSLTTSHPADLNFFAEIRSTSEKKNTGRLFSLYRRGGLSTVQVGIESLSNSLLKKMKKGSTVIENIAAMRGAQEHFINLEGNLIIQFPGSTQDEVNETLANLDFVLSYKPLDIATFFLGFDSPVYASPDKFNIKAIVNHSNNSKLFPPAILKKLDLIVMEYRGDRTLQKMLWRPVTDKIKEWQKFHRQRNVSALEKPPLYYRDGNDFLIVRQELFDGRVLNHRLTGTSREIYLYCAEIRTDDGLKEKFNRISWDKIQIFLADLRNKRLLFSDDNKHLSLAVHRK
jgi:ribosomal peptide maturation radical SAM protein 1